MRNGRAGALSFIKEFAPHMDHAVLNVIEN
jgi:hypothetical protein